MVSSPMMRASKIFLELVDEEKGNKTRTQFTEELAEQLKKLAKSLEKEL